MDKDYQKGFFLTEEEGGVLRFEFTRGSKTKEDSSLVAQHAQKEIEALLEKYGDHEALLLVELVEDDGLVSKEARNIYKEIMNDTRIMRMAIFGGLKKYRIIAKALLPTMMRHPIKVFTTN